MKLDEKMIKPPIGKVTRVHIFLQKARAFIKEVPVKKGSDWEKNKKCALEDIERAIAVLMPVSELWDPCSGQIIRKIVEKNPARIEDFQPRPKKK